MEINKRQAKYFLGRIYNYLRTTDRKVVMDKLHESWGELDWETGDISIDPTSALLPTVIHECLHALYGDVEGHPGSVMDADRGQCSKWVQQAEDEISRHMSKRQWHNLMNLVVCKFYESTMD